jgi:hydroxymethylglutaryl-CoA lyase
MTSTLIIHEVGLRDGLQMEQQTVPLDRKIRWIADLAAAGVDVIQLGSFVHPEKVPQMADTDRLFQHFQSAGKPAGVILSGLVLNEKGLERGLACGVDMFCMGVSASESHSKKNTGMAIAEATDRITAIAQKAVAAGKKVQVSVQSAFGCGYEGPVPQERVMKIVERYMAAGIRNISLADTAGHATPDRVEQMFRAILELDSDITLACHFHNTYGMAIANCYAAMQAGVTYYESSVAGLGGCPFTKIAGGNVSTEDLVHMLHRMNLRPELRLDRLIAVAQDVAAFFNKDLPGTVYRTGPIPEPASHV